MNLALHKKTTIWWFFYLRIDRDTNYNFILLIIEKLIIIFYLLFLLWLTHQRRGISHVEST